MPHREVIGGGPATTPEPAQTTAMPSVRERIRSQIGQREVQAQRVPELGATPAQPFVSAGEAVGEAIGPTTKQAIKQGALPVAGNILGFVVGTPFGPAVALTLESLGGAAGEALNQLFGITQPSAGQIVAEGTLPGVARGIRTAARLLPPTTKGARVLNELAPQEAEQVIARMTPKQASKQLFEDATSQGIIIPMPIAAARLDQMITELSARSTPGSALAPLRRLQAKLEASGLELSPRELQNELATLGELVSSFKRTGKTGSGQVQQTFKALIKDLDAAAALPGAASTLKLARKTFLRERALDDLSDTILGATKAIKGQGDAVSFNGAEVIRKMRKDEFFTKAFTPDEQKEIISLLAKLNRIPGLAPSAGQQFGSGRFFGGLGALGAGGAAAGQLVGEPATGAAVGVVTGLTIPPIVNAVRVISQSLHFETGKAMLKEFLTTSQGILSPTHMSRLAAFLTAQAAEVGSSDENP